jgi:hypothetical protein
MSALASLCHLKSTNCAASVWYSDIFANRFCSSIPLNCSITRERCRKIKREAQLKRILSDKLRRHWQLVLVRLKNIYDQVRSFLYSLKSLKCHKTLREKLQVWWIRIKWRTGFPGYSLQNCFTTKRSSNKFWLIDWLFITDLVQLQNTNCII